jgi:hypothetical protein
MPQAGTMLMDSDEETLQAGTSQSIVEMAVEKSSVQNGGMLHQGV